MSKYVIEGKPSRSFLILTTFFVREVTYPQVRKSVLEKLNITEEPYVVNIVIGHSHPVTTTTEQVMDILKAIPLNTKIVEFSIGFSEQAREGVYHLPLVASHLYSGVLQAVQSLDVMPFENIVFLNDLARTYRRTIPEKAFFLSDIIIGFSPKCKYAELPKDKDVMYNRPFGNVMYLDVQ